MCQQIAYVRCIPSIVHPWSEMYHLFRSEGTRWTRCGVGLFLWRPCLTVTPVMLTRSPLLLHSTSKDISSWPFSIAMPPAVSAATSTPPTADQRCAPRQVLHGCHSPIHLAIMPSSTSLRSVPFLICLWDPWLISKFDNRTLEPKSNGTLTVSTSSALHAVPLKLAQLVLG